MYPKAIKSPGGGNNQQSMFHLHDMRSCGRSMSRFKPACAFAAVLILTSALAGCAAYRNSGFGGCCGNAQITAEASATDGHG